ncbi:MAG: hypothetical protein WA280_01445 [Xanthobacteraceae bacterium]
MQQQELRRVGRPRFAIEDFKTVGIGGAIVDRRHENLLLGDRIHEIKAVIL